MNHSNKFWVWAIILIIIIVIFAGIILANMRKIPAIFGGGGGRKKKLTSTINEIASRENLDDYDYDDDFDDFGNSILEPKHKNKKESTKYHNIMENIVHKKR